MVEINKAYGKEKLYAMIELTNAKPENRELLWNIHQKYLYEMTYYYDDEMDEQGNFKYGYFDAYFTEVERKAIFIYEQKELVGFAMINPYPYISENPDYVLAEFTIFPMYRKKHLATEAAEAIFGRYRGRWEIKYSEKNTRAKNLWNKITEKYIPRIIHLNEDETVLAFTVQGGK